MNDNWYPIRSTRGVHQIVRFNNEKPLPVRDEIIERIRADSGSAARREPFLRPGDRVRISEGPFAQLEAIFLAKSGDERVVLLLNALHTDRKLTFPVKSVQKIAS